MNKKITIGLVVLLITTIAFATYTYLQLQASKQVIEELHGVIVRMTDSDPLLDEHLKGHLERLKQHNDLIDFKGVLGGTSQIYEVVLLDNTHALARFEDGHVAGSAIFDLKKIDSKLQWQKLSEVLD